MKFLGLFIFIVFFATLAKGQTRLPLSVGGTTNNYYPVTFKDAAWDLDRATEFEIGRSNLNEGNSHGSLIAKFRYHTTRYGNGCQLINTDINEFDGNFIAKYKDATMGNTQYDIVVWLRGGTQYFYTSNFTISPTVYLNGFTEQYASSTIFNGPQAYVESSINPQGLTVNSVYASAGGQNYFNGNVGIGTTSPAARLDVNGLTIVHGLTSTDYVQSFSHFYARDGIKIFNKTENGWDDFAIRNVSGSNATYDLKGISSVGIGADVPSGYRLAVNGDAIFNKVRVKLYPWPDYVFNSSYKLRSLKEVETYIKTYKHLPDVPSAKQIAKSDLDIGASQATLLRKIEELTLYMIEQDKKIQVLATKLAEKK